MDRYHFNFRFRSNRKKSCFPLEGIPCMVQKYKFTTSHGLKTFFPYDRFSLSKVQEKWTIKKI